MNPKSINHRMQIDVMRLMSSYDVTTVDTIRSLLVKFPGPAGTPYEGGNWLVRVILPDDYPFKSPCVGFATQIFHPNVDEQSGTICVDVLNQNWTALYDLLIIFDTFLPQLLRHPNPEDPLNHCAARVLTRNPERYNVMVAKHVQEFANPVTINFSFAKKEEDEYCSELSEDDDH